VITNAGNLPGVARPRLAELIASLSLAIDLEVGQPLEHVMRAALVAVRLGESQGLGEAELADVYYLALLAYVGCTAEAHVIAEATGNDISNNAMVLPVHYGASTEVLGVVLRQLGRGYPVLDRARLIARAMATMARQSKAVTVAHCEVGQLLARQLGLGSSVIEALGQVYERWDGSGLPRKLKGELIMPTMRVVHVAHDGALMYRLGGSAAAISTVRRHAGAAHDPEIAARFCRDADTLLGDAGTASAWDAVLAAEPGPRPRVSATQFETALAAMGDFADLK
jgi:response regulator RpfG family c-di-GMP phosphodiesterase